MKHFAGIGSRDTPKHVLTSMTMIARELAAAGYTLRSGGARGAASAFEAGATSKVIYLPWPGFNDNPSPYCNVSAAALQMASAHHPCWDKLSKFAQALHGRNCYQVLGLDLMSKADFVVCWHKGTGGTMQAVRIASAHAIPVYNLDAWSARAVLDRVLRAG